MNKINIKYKDKKTEFEKNGKHFMCCNNKEAVLVFDVNIGVRWINIEHDTDKIMEEYNKINGTNFEYFKRGIHKKW